VGCPLVYVNFKLLYLEGAQGSGAQAVADSMRTEMFPVTSGAVDFIVGTIVQIGRIQWTVAVTAVEAATMPDSIFADHLFGSVDVVAAAGASFTFRCLQAQFLGPVTKSQDRN